MTLKHARGNFRALKPFLSAVDESPRGWRRFTAGGFIPLSVERLYYEQNGFPALPGVSFFLEDIIEGAK